MICCTPELERRFQQRFDAHGDSYVDELNVETLRRILEQMDVEVNLIVNYLCLFKIMSPYII